MIEIVNIFKIKFFENYYQIILYEWNRKLLSVITLNTVFSNEKITSENNSREFVS